MVNCMRKILLILCLLIVPGIVATGTAMATVGLPCDANSDGKLTNGEVSSAVISYMKGNASAKLDDVRDAAHVLTYWGGTAYTFKDRKNITTTIYRPAKRIVDVEGAYGPQTLVALGAADKIVGITDYALTQADLSPFIKNLPSVGNWQTPDGEKIMALNPDLVHGYGYAGSPDLSSQQKALKAIGVPLIQLDCYKPEYYTEDITILGKIVGEEENASKLIAFQDYYENLVADRIKGLNDSQRPMVFMETLTNFMTGDSSAAYIDSCGGNNVFSEVTKSTAVSSEEIIKRNPKVIIKKMYKGDDSRQDQSGAVSNSAFGATNDTGVKALYKKVMARSGWDQIDAVKNGRVYLIHSDTTSVHPCANTVYVAKMIHPELFKDISGDEVLRQWYKEFMNVDFTGIYAYPMQT
jgi:ABC-type Fe3+-hydroxamate transport system, periplasmic component